MCGIAGIIGNGNFKPALLEMLHAQKHRGPDATGLYEDAGHAVLGHNRLSIIDLSEDANQPFADASGRYVMVFNGEVYNYLELKDELADYPFRTQCDTEVLLAAYIKWGKECLGRFNGMFSFAIWDNREKTLFAARDRFGVKPFYYHFDQGTFYFASEIKSLFAAGIRKLPEEKAWASFLAFGSYGMPDETFWEGIRQLPGGNWLTFADGKLQSGQWYDFVSAVGRQPSGLSYGEAKEHYLGLLRNSVRLRFRADVPVGFNISGGLDSSVLLAMVNDYAGSPKNIKAYTFYTGHPDYDELPWVEMMISATGNPLEKVLLNSKEVPGLARLMAHHQDEPFGGIPTLAYSQLFKTARSQGTIVLLDGQGMDEQWAGYDYYTKNIDSVVQGVAASPLRPGVLSPEFLSHAQKPDYPKPFDDAMLNLQYRDLFYTKIPRALRFNDRVSMAYSTELREPFLDHNMVEFAFSLPAEYKIRNGVTKKMLREIASEFLAADLVFAPKRPLQTPQREWLAGDLSAFISGQVEAILQSPFARWFDADALRKEWSQYRNGDNQSAFHIWQWANLALDLLQNDESSITESK